MARSFKSIWTRGITLTGRLLNAGFFFTMTLRASRTVGTKAWTLLIIYKIKIKGKVKPPADAIEHVLLLTILALDSEKGATALASVVALVKFLIKY